MRARTAVKVPRLIAWRVMIPNQVSIWLSHDEPTGVKWKVTFGFFSSQARTSGRGVRGQVVQHDPDLLPGVRLHRFLEEVEEVLPIAGRATLAEHLPGRHVQRGEQIRRAVPDVVVGLLLNLPAVQRQ